jgi:putative restriction endonuclease
MQAFLAVTDNDWFDFLSRQPDLDEVNFWTPSGKRLANFDVGQPVLFKLHSPLNFVVGGGFFAHFSLLPVSLAWDAFREKNGAASYDQMRARIEKYRRIAPNPREDYEVGCEILADPFFLSRDHWISVPEDFSRNIVRGKSYDIGTGAGKKLWDQVLEERALQRHSAAERPEQPMYGDLTLVRPRIGQGAFRVMVADRYQRRCAVTREKALPALEAAHIRPVADGGVHSVDNGMLLRADVHKLFDRGYVTVTPDHRFRVSRRLKDEYHNGEHYFQLQGRTIWVPRHLGDQPTRERLQWHNDTVFKG